MAKKKGLRRRLDVSVIVPYYNDLESLRTCVDALLGQSCPKAKFEVILVNNGGEAFDPPSVGSHPRIHLLEESHPGSYAARNRGIEEAAGDILAFTDADAEPVRDWLAKGVKAIRAGAEVVGGGVQVFPKNARAPRAAEVYDARFSLRQARYIREFKYAVTANLFARRSVFEEHGVFNGGLKSGGDAEWGRRVSRGGVEIQYCAQALVRHPARGDLASLVQKARRVIGGHFDTDAAKSEDLGRFGKLVRDLSMQAGSWKPMARDLFSGDLGPTDGPVLRAQLFAILTVVCGTRFVERLRLELGAESQRR